MPSRAPRPRKRRPRTRGRRSTPCLKYPEKGVTCLSKELTEGRCTECEALYIKRQRG